MIPHMINIGHFYAYYEHYEDLVKAMNDNIPFLESSTGETVLSILLSKQDPNKTIIGKCIENMLS